MSVSFDDHHACRSELLENTARFLSHLEMLPDEAFLITLTEVAAGWWLVENPDAPGELFEAVRSNCDEDVQQIRIIGPKFSDRFAELTDAAAPYATRSWVDGRYLWLDFDWPCLREGEPPPKRRDQ